MSAMFASTEEILSPVGNWIKWKYCRFNCDSGAFSVKNAQECTPWVNSQEGAAELIIAHRTSFQFFCCVDWKVKNLVSYKLEAKMN